MPDKLHARQNTTLTGSFLPYPGSFLNTMVLKLYFPDKLFTLDKLTGGKK